MSLVDRLKASAGSYLSHHGASLSVGTLVLGFVVVILAVIPLPVLSDLQASNLELLIRIRSVIRLPKPVAALTLVRIDAAGERVVGSRWPFTREVLGRMLDRLCEEGARVVVFHGLGREPTLRNLSPEDAFGVSLRRWSRALVPMRQGGPLTLGLGGLVLDDVGDHIETIDGHHQLVALDPAPGRRTGAVPWQVRALEKFSGQAAVIGQKSCRFGERVVRLSQGRIRVDPGVLGHIQTVGVGEILTGAVESGRFRDHLVLVGRVGDDVTNVPVLPGLAASELEIHAGVLAALLTGETLVRPPFLVGLLLTLLTFVYTLQIGHSPRHRQPIMITKVTLILLLMPLAALLWARTELDVSRPMLVFSVALPCVMALHIAFDKDRKGVIASTVPGDASVAGSEAPLLPKEGPGSPVPVPVPPVLDAVTSGPAPVDLDAFSEVASGADNVLTRLVTQYLGDRYQRMELIGSGGMGMVFRAHSVGLQAMVALKVLHPQHAARTDLTDRFFREYDLGLRLSHPGFVRVFERGRSGLHYFSMELLIGHSLRTEMTDCGCLGWRRSAAVIRALAAAMDHAHGQGVLHRDLKPDNLWLLDSGGLKVLDLGIAHSDTGGTLTGTGQVLGTLRYMSPEQIDGRPVGPAADVFSAGVVLFEMLCNELPYRAADVERRVDRLPIELAAFDPEAPGGLDQLVLECLAHDPSDRPQSFAQVIGRLDTLARSART